MLETKKTPKSIVEEKGFVQISDENALAEIVKAVLANNQKSVDDYHNGKTNALGFFGRTMYEGNQRPRQSG